MRPSTLLPILAVLFTSIEASRSRRSLNTGSSEAVADSSNSDTTSSEDSDYIGLEVQKVQNVVPTPAHLNFIISSALEPVQYPTMPFNINEERKWDSDEEDDGLNYRPLIIEEPQVDPRNFMNRIMAQYRADMGFNTLADPNEAEAAPEEVKQFLDCLEPNLRKVDEQREVRRQARSAKRAAKEQTPERIKREEVRNALKAGRKQRKFQKKVEAFSFLRFIRKIPLAGEFAGMNCEQKQKATGMRKVSDLRKIYKSELHNFNNLNWDLIDLTHFAYQRFPVMDTIKITDEETDEPTFSFTPKSIDIIRRYADRIRFHNPNTLQGRQKLVFQKIYKLYYDSLIGTTSESGSSWIHPHFVNWEHCKVLGWPKGVNRTSIESWRIKHLNSLEEALDDGTLKFVRADLIRTNQPRPLGITKNPIDFITNGGIISGTSFDDIEGQDDCSLSDDEKIVGKVMDKPLYVLAETRNLYRKQTGDIFAKEFDWDLLKKGNFPYHQVPFNTDFKNIEGAEHIANLRIYYDLYTKKKIKFLNLSTKRSDIIARIVERLYAKCRSDIGRHLHPYKIVWDRLNVFGLPDDIVPNRPYHWSDEKVKIVKNLLDENAISFELKPEFASTALDVSLKSAKPEEQSPEPVEKIVGGLLASQKTRRPARKSVTAKKPAKRSHSEVGAEIVEGDVVAPVASTPTKRSRKPKQQAVPEVESEKETPTIFNEVNQAAKDTLDCCAEISGTRSHHQRINRIVSEIERAVKLIQEFTTEPTNQMITSEELVNYLELCYETLKNVKRDGSVDQSILTTFIIGAIKFRARLHGAKLEDPSNPTSRVIITQNLIADKELFKFLTKQETKWNYELLEGFIDCEDIPIFITPKISVISKRN